MGSCILLQAKLPILFVNYSKLFLLSEEALGSKAEFFGIARGEGY